MTLTKEEPIVTEQNTTVPQHERYPSIPWYIKVWLVPLAFLAGYLEALYLRLKGE
jgi:hypothetical protein